MNCVQFLTCRWWANKNSFSFRRRGNKMDYTTESSTEYAATVPPELEDDFTIPTTQTALLLHGVRQPYQLTQDYPVSEIRGDRELLVRNHAIGLNPIDWKSPDFGFGIPELPFLSGRESAGVVCTTPRSKSRLQRGSRVIAISTDYRDCRKATYQEFTVAPDFNLVRLPDSLSVTQGATLGVAYVAAVLALGVCFGVDFSEVHDGPDLINLVRSKTEETLLPQDIQQECLEGIQTRERAKPGDWIAVWGGSSTSANMVVQLARMAGLRVISVVDKAKHGLRMSDQKDLRPDLLVDSHDAERAIAIIRANVGGNVRFGIDTRGRDTAESLLRVLSPRPEAREGPFATPPGTPPAGAFWPAHLVGLSGLPKGAPPDGVVFHSVPIKVFHEVPAIGEALSGWLERLLGSGAVVPPRIIGVERGLNSVNQGLDRMRRGEISGGKLVVSLVD